MSQISSDKAKLSQNIVRNLMLNKLVFIMSFKIINLKKNTIKNKNKYCYLTKIPS